MPDNQILSAARRDQKGAVDLCIVLLVIGGVVLGLNWKYVYNAVSGPQPFTAALAAEPGSRQWVSARGTLIPTGWAQKSTLSLLHGAVKSEVTSAQYLAMLVDGRLLVVEAEPEFTGQEVNGRLVALPAEIQSSIGDALKPYPWMVDATGSYRWDPNLFVMIAVPVMALSLLALPYCIWSGRNVERHGMIKRLASLGPPLEVSQALARELFNASAADRVAGATVTQSAVVSLTPLLMIAPLRDLTNAALKTTTTKSGTKHEVVLKVRDSIVSDHIECSLADAQKLLARIAQRAPNAVNAPAA